MIDRPVLSPAAQSPNRLPTVCFVAPDAFPVLSGDTDVPTIGGAEVQQVIVAKELVKRGYTVSMICRDFGQPDEVEVHGITVFRTYRLDDGLPIVRFVWPRLISTWRCLERADADIYYQRTASMLTGVVAEFCLRNGKKSVFAAAGNPDFEPRTSRIQYARDRWIYEYGLRHVDQILAQNKEQERLCLANFGRRSTLVPNCYPLPESRQKGTGRYVLWVSTIRKLKRPELFLDLAQALPQFRFRMIGGPVPDEAPLYEAIRKRARTISNLEFLGFVPYAQVENHFDDASIFVNTSESEGFPNSFLQSWARGVPTVSFIDSGAGADGRRIGRQVGTFAEMVDRVAAWLGSDADRAREGRVCREYFSSNHLPTRVLEVYERIFTEMAGSETG